MITFAYEARDASGRIVSGIQDAPERRQVTNHNCLPRRSFTFVLIRSLPAHSPPAAAVGPSTRRLPSTPCCQFPSVRAGTDHNGATGASDMAGNAAREAVETLRERARYNSDSQFPDDIVFLSSCFPAARLLVTPQSRHRGTKALLRCCPLIRQRTDSPWRTSACPPWRISELAAAPG